MVKSLIKTVINAIWVILVCLEISQVISSSQAFGYALIALYFGVLIVFRPMRPLYKAIFKPDINIPLERQASNKVYSITLLAIKIILLISCVGIIISGAILYKLIFLRPLASKIHFLCIYWAFLAASIQLGVNANIAIIPKLNEKAQKGCYYAGYLGVFAGIIISIQSQYAIALFRLNEYMISVSSLQAVFLVIGFISIGITVNHLTKRSMTVKE